MYKTKYFINILAVLLTLYSCNPIEQLSPVPNIRFEDFTIFDTVDILGNEAQGGQLRFYFEDGDGDIGLVEPDNVLADTNNLFLTLYRKTNGILVPAPQNDPLQPSNFRIPFMEREGQNKILKGTITVTFMYLFYTSTDTILYDFYIVDRAMNQSNVVSTNEIIVSENNTY